MLINSFMSNKEIINAPTFDAITSSLDVVDKPSLEGATNSNMKHKHSHNYKGGHITQHGYKLIYVGKLHHLSNPSGYAYEHRIVAEKKYKRRLKNGEHVHHIDGDKLNNSPENIVILSASEHRFIHRIAKSNKKHPSEGNPIIKCACGCGEEFLKYDESNRPRKYKLNHYEVFKNGTVGDSIIKYLNYGDKDLTSIIKQINSTKSTVKTILTNLCKMNLIVRVSHGIYGKAGTDKIIKENPIIKCKCGCNNEFLMFDKKWRKREYISGHNNPKNK